MPNMDPKKCPMPMQDPVLRCRNFEEAALGYTYEMAVSEAKRCLNCKHKPCVKGCPVGNDIPGFIAKIVEGDLEGAYEILSATNALPAVCGRVCPQEQQCEGGCVRGIKGEAVGIGRLERFVADWHRTHHTTQLQRPAGNGLQVAVVGSGPSGLTAAGDLAKLGYEVTIYEAMDTVGGILMYGIPEFRLPKEIVQNEIRQLEQLGVHIKTGVSVGRELTIDELFSQGNRAVFIGSGAAMPRMMHILGEELSGVYTANEFLTRINLMQAYRPDSQAPLKPAKRVAIVGGGNVAMDAARCARRLPAEEVHIVYRRGMEELPACQGEIEEAQEEGIVFRTLANPIEILGDAQGNVTGMVCQVMELGEPDASGRRRPVAKEGCTFTLEVDAVVMAIGTDSDPLLSSTTPGLEVDRYGCIIVDSDSGATSREGVYAGGDAVTGPATVILAMGAGKRAAKSIDAYLKAKYR